MSGELIFEEPPADKRKRQRAGQTPLGLWLAALRGHPGKWTRYHELISAGTAGNISKARSHGVQAGEYETTTRPDPDGTSKRVLYARYVGGGAS